MNFLAILAFFLPNECPDTPETVAFTARQWLVFAAIAAPALIWALS